eukprot:9497331-Pyramimonas_sp.AAC.1
MHAESRPMTAKDMCVTAWWAKEAGSVGDATRLGMHPKNARGELPNPFGHCRPEAIPRRLLLDRCAHLF